MLGRQTGRKALVVFTDGEDQGSHATIDDVERRLQSSDVTLYMIGQGRGVTDRAAEEDHGAAVGADRRPRALHRQHRRAPRARSPICSTSCRTSTCSATSPTNTQARRRVAEDQGGRRRPPRRAGAAGLPRAGGQMTTGRNRGASRRLAETNRLGSVLCVSACSAVAVRVASAAAAAAEAAASSRRSRSRRSTSTVVDDKGKPIAEPDARPTSPCEIDGNARRVVTAEWVPLGGEAGRRRRRRRPTATAPTRARPAAG